MATSRESIMPRVASMKTWWAIIGLSLCGVGFGVYSFLFQEHGGDIVTGLRMPGFGGAAWGLYIAAYVYFVGVSFAGIVVAALSRLFEVKVLKPVTRIAEVLTITSLLAGAACVVADLGRPFDGLTKLPRFAKPASPFFGTFTLVVAGYLFSSLIYFFLDGRRDAVKVAAVDRSPLRIVYRLWGSGYQDSAEERARHRRVSFWLSIFILPMLVTASSTLGFVFGIQSGRPGWYSALQAPAFVVLAATSGTGILILVTLAARRVFRLAIGDDTLRWLGNLMWILACVYLYFILVEELTAGYAAPSADRAIAHEVTSGHFRTEFWIVVCGLFLTAMIPFLMWVRNRVSMGWLAVAAITGNVAAVFRRMLIVVPSQTHGALLPVEKGGFYTPQWMEIGLVVGLASVVVLLIFAFGRFFPYVPSGEEPKKAVWPPPFELPRTLVTGLTILGAGALVVIGLLDSFRSFSHGETDPRFPGSPIVFAGGVILLFVGAALYEIMPRARRSR
jgi:molybdopterin-containing oxidoreductase family membrane subunit